MPQSKAASTPPRGHACEMFQAADLLVTTGANLGDGLAGPEDVCPGDVYTLASQAQPLRMRIAHAEAQGRQHIAEGSAVGRPGDPVDLIARYTMMTPDGDMVEVFLVRLVPQGGAAPGALFVLPLSPLAPRRDYALIKAEAPPVSARLGDLLCLSFGRGTGITLSTGVQRPIEDLRIGDRVLTRDHGARPIRWIGHATLRATGAFAPVVIGRGAMGNSGDLVVSQQHRMFLYRRDRTPRLGTAEVLVQARDLVDDEAIVLRPGGHVEYFSLIFDAHEIVYAEGIPAESLLVNEATLSRLPHDLAADLRQSCPGLDHRQHFGTEAEREDFDDIGLPRQRCR